MNRPPLRSGDSGLDSVDTLKHDLVGDVRLAKRCEERVADTQSALARRGANPGAATLDGSTPGLCSGSARTPLARRPEIRSRLAAAIEVRSWSASRKLATYFASAGVRASGSIPNFWRISSPKRSSIRLMWLGLAPYASSRPVLTITTTPATSPPLLRIWLAISATLPARTLTSSTITATPCFHSTIEDRLRDKPLHGTGAGVKGSAVLNDLCRDARARVIRAKSGEGTWNIVMARCFFGKDWCKNHVGREALTRALKGAGPNQIADQAQPRQRHPPLPLRSLHAR